MMFGKKRRDSGAGDYLTHLERLATDSEWSHGYETLVTSLSTRPNGKLASILITSTQPAEGKTTVTVNLGMAMAMAGRNVLLVDADFRRPSFGTMFSHTDDATDSNDNGLGLIDVLDGRRNENEVVRHVTLPPGRDGEEARVGVVAAGRSASRRFSTLGSPRFDAALETWTRDTDVVLIDSPPLLAVSDALLIAPKVEGVLLVVEAGSVSERELKRSKASLENAGGKLVGVFMNLFDDRAGPAYHPYSRYYIEE